MSFRYHLKCNEGRSSNKEPHTSDIRRHNLTVRTRAGSVVQRCSTLLFLHLTNASYTFVYLPCFYSTCQGTVQRCLLQFQHQRTTDNWYPMRKSPQEIFTSTCQLHAKTWTAAPSYTPTSTYNGQLVSNTKVPTRNFHFPILRSVSVPSRSSLDGNHFRALRIAGHLQHQEINVRHEDWHTD